MGIAGAGGKLFRNFPQAQEIYGWPLAPCAGRAVRPATMRTRRLLCSPWGLERMRILIVADHPPVAGFMPMGLRREFHTVECVAPGAEARSLLDETECDLPILGSPDPEEAAG
jgi:hypothetical protein